jgi:hypothetical protein
MLHHETMLVQSLSAVAAMGLTGLVVALKSVRDRWK